MAEFTTRYGTISAPDLEDDLICRALAELGEWAFTEQELLAAMMRSEEVLWDCGAFLGTFGLGAVQIASDAGRAAKALVAIEPGADIQPYLRRNLANNCPCPFTIAEFAISEKPQKLGLRSESSDGANLGGRAYEAAVGPTNLRQTVEGRPLRLLRETFGDYTCLKLDLEGMELQALRSDFEYIRETQPLIWIECNEEPASLKVLEALLSLGYDPMYVAVPAFRPDNFNESPDLIYPMAYEATLVGATPERIAGLESAAARSPVEIILHSARSVQQLRQALWITPRWAKQEWAEMSQEELIALLGRMHRRRAPWLTPRRAMRKWSSVGRAELIARLGRIYLKEKQAGFLNDR